MAHGAQPAAGRARAVGSSSAESASFPTMATKKQLVATSEAGFVSVESSTPEKPRGTFIPLVETPRRSPRLAAKRKRERSHNTSSASTCKKNLAPM